MISDSEHFNRSIKFCFFQPIAFIVAFLSTADDSATCSSIRLIRHKSSKFFSNSIISPFLLFSARYVAPASYSFGTSLCCTVRTLQSSSVDVLTRRTLCKASTYLHGRRQCGATRIFKGYAWDNLRFIQSTEVPTFLRK